MGRAPTQAGQVWSERRHRAVSHLRNSRFVQNFTMRFGGPANEALKPCEGLPGKLAVKLAELS